MKKEENIIDNYRKLSLGKYQEIMRARQDESCDDLTRQVRILSILTDKTEDELLNLPLTEYSALAARSRYLEKLDVDDAAPIAKVYLAGDFELVPVTDHRKVTTAQYIDFQEYAKGGEDNLVEVLSCLLIPKGKQYNQGYDVIDVQRAIRDEMSVADGLALTAFFFNSWRRLITDSLTYSRKEAMALPEGEKKKAMLQEINKQMERLNQSGDGSPM